MLVTRQLFVVFQNLASMIRDLVCELECELACELVYELVCVLVYELMSEWLFDLVPVQDADSDFEHK